MSATVLVLALALPRSVVLERRCHSQIGSSSVTLFERGAVRIGSRSGDTPEIVSVRELSPNDLEGYHNRIRQLDLEEVPLANQVGRTTDGDWIEACELTVQLPGTVPRTWAWNTLDTRPLALASLDRIVDELGVGAEMLRATRLPQGYDPAPGDQLRRVDGRLFRVVTKTSDEMGVELQGVDDPLVMFVPIGQMGEEFVELVQLAAPLR
jgi:hypothetical protein